MSRRRQKASAFSKASADKSPGKRGRIRAERVEVRWLDGAKSFATLTIDEMSPEILMIDGEPFVRAEFCGVAVEQGRSPLYLQVKPYRVDAGLLEGL
ncbi:hypothetical protein AB7M63_003638 [Bradyrhizobium japonicum]